MISSTTRATPSVVAALLTTIFDDRVIRAAGMRYARESAPPECRRAYWVAQRRDAIVGWAVGGLDAFAQVRTTAFAGIAVHPEHRREGIGRALLDGVSAHLDEIGARRIVVHSRADEHTKEQPGM